MNEAIQFLQKHQKKGVLLDANVLLVYVVGLYDPKMVSKFHHTKQYIEDIDWIIPLIAWLGTVYTTPHVLTEVSNLGKDLGVEFYSALQKLISILDEHSCESREAANDQKFTKLGLTDVAIAKIASSGKLVVTGDHDLYAILRHRNVDAINISHLRQMQWEGKGRT